MTGLAAACRAQVELADACVEAFDSCSRLRLDDRENVELIAAATATAIAQVWMMLLPLTLEALDLEITAGSKKLRPGQSSMTAHSSPFSSMNHLQPS